MFLWLRRRRIDKRAVIDWHTRGGSNGSGDIIGAHFRLRPVQVGKGTSRTRGPRQRNHNGKHPRIQWQYQGMQRDTSGYTRHLERHLTVAEILPELTFSTGGDRLHWRSERTKPQSKTLENSLGTSGNATIHPKIHSSSREESKVGEDITKALSRLHGKKEDDAYY